MADYFWTTLRRTIFFAAVAIIFTLTVGCRTPEKFAVASDGERTVEIGILLRRQFSTDACKSSHYRHIDTLFPDGAIYGFNTSAYDNSFAQNVLFNSRGEVRTNPKIWQMRKHYIDRETAKNFTFHGKAQQRAITDWLRLRITPEQNAKLRRAWEELADNPPEFRLTGKNCATRAMECLASAGILPPIGIPGLDRPENLRELIEKYYPETTSTRGYFWLDENRHPQIEVVNCP